MRRTVVRGRRGPGLVGTAARTAVIAGTATAVAGRVAAAQQPGAPGPAPAAPAAPAGPAPSAEARPPLDVDHLRTQLVALDELRQAGLLTDEEFAAKKARLFAE